MKAWVISRRILMTWFGLFGLFGSCAAVAEPPPAASFGKLPQMMSVNLSPDGTRAVVLRALNDSYHVTLLDFTTHKSSMLMAAKPDEFLFNWCRWANNVRIVCSFRSYIVLRAGQIGVARRSYRDGRTVMTRLLAVNADGSNVLQLVPPSVQIPRHSPPESVQEVPGVAPLELHTPIHSTVMEQAWPALALLALHTPWQSVSVVHARPWLEPFGLQTPVHSRSSLQDVPGLEPVQIPRH